MQTLIVLGYGLENDQYPKYLDVDYPQFDRVIFCGGPTLVGSNLTEAEVMKKIAVDQGCPQEKIVLENESLTTLQNFQNLKLESSPVTIRCDNGRTVRILIIASAILGSKFDFLPYDFYPITPQVIVKEIVFSGISACYFIPYLGKLLQNWETSRRKRQIAAGKTATIMS